jgi:hypothetical protein
MHILRGCAAAPVVVHEIASMVKITAKIVHAKWAETEKPTHSAAGMRSGVQAWCDFPRWYHRLK